jgi:hypothetical protein
MPDKPNGKVVVAVEALKVPSLQQTLRLDTSAAEQFRR